MKRFTKVLLVPSATLHAPIPFAAIAIIYHTAGGLAHMPTKPLPEFMAVSAVSNAVANHGWNTHGPITIACKKDAVSTTCATRHKPSNEDKVFDFSKMS